MSIFADAEHEIDQLVKRAGDHDVAIGELKEHVEALEKWREEAHSTVTIQSADAAKEPCVSLGKVTGEDVPETSDKDEIARQPATDLSQLDAPEPPPLAEAGAVGDRRRSPAEMVEAVLSNLSLCIDADGVPKPVTKRLLEAQRWALILKKHLD